MPTVADGGDSDLMDG